MDPSPSLLPWTHLSLRPGCLPDDDVTVYTAGLLLAAQVCLRLPDA